jgi:hypothetical protein
MQSYSQRPQATLHKNPSQGYYSRVIVQVNQVNTKQKKKDNVTHILEMWTQIWNTISPNCNYHLTVHCVSLIHFISMLQ